MQQLIDKYVGSRVWEPWYWYQCVGWCKVAWKELYGIQLGSFWWSAKLGWQNVNGTFNWYDRWTGRPIPWDMIFFDTYPPYGHVAIVTQAFDWWIEVIEQNGWEGAWNGLGNDAIRLNTYTYDTVLGWYNAPRLSSKDTMETKDYVIPYRDGKVFWHLDSRPEELDKYRAIIMVSNGINFWSPYIGKWFQSTKYISAAHLQIFTWTNDDLPVKFPENWLAKGWFGRVFFNDEFDWKNDYKFLYGVTHEVGHAIGCGHCENDGCVMNPMYRDLHENMKLCDEHKEFLSTKYM